MLLPSALSCDSSQSPQNQQQQRSRLPIGLFASPPASPPTLSSSQHAFGNIVNTCRSLQSLMTTPPPHAPPEASFPSLAQLPTPPMAYAPPPMKLRLRSRRPGPAHADNSNITTSDEAPSNNAPPRRIVKKRTAGASAAPRGIHKRRRSVDDDLGRESDYSSSDDEAAAPAAAVQEPTPANSDELSPPSPLLPPAPSTPKRARIAPEQLPLGLERSDFHDVHRLEAGADLTENSGGADEWTAEDDRMLVELVLEKLKLSKTEWQDCARNLGKDRHSLSRRWKSLMMNGDVGLKRSGASSRRARLHSTWR
ncbi:hypothetical protein K4F52_006452 [Lecanicillium sp. MT-2017a]|nr:hypothetical protein K4F52_006452 [Lecanicillium sp. MT-2017a]